MTYELIMQGQKGSKSPQLIARHVDPSWLMQRGYEVARSLGSHAAIWQASSSGIPGARLALNIGHEARLTIERGD